jgi:hypothetical protein
VTKVEQEKSMSKTKVSKTLSSTGKEKKKEWPVVVYFWTFGLGALGYVLSNVGLVHLPHSYHWVTGIIGAVAGILIGWVWYRWRGDII